MKARRLAALPTCLLVGALALSSCTQVTNGAATASHPSSGSSPTNSSTATPTVPPYHAAKASFRDCTNVLTENGITGNRDEHGKLSMGCATIHVPLDYLHPDGGTIDVTMIKVHDSDNKN